jgi:hypothetical protein
LVRAARSRAFFVLALVQVFAELALHALHVLFHVEQLAGAAGAVHIVQPAHPRRACRDAAL